MHAHIKSTEAADCHLSFKWSQEFCGPALSREALWMTVGRSVTDAFIEKQIYQKNAARKNLGRLALKNRSLLMKDTYQS